MNQLQAFRITKLIDKNPQKAFYLRAKYLANDILRDIKKANIKHNKDFCICLTQDILYPFKMDTLWSTAKQNILNKNNKYVFFDFNWNDIICTNITWNERSNVK